MDQILRFLKKIIPRRLQDLLLPWYHEALVRVAAFWYGHPSEKMIVIGVTGTKGKSTTTFLISKVLEETGYKVGFTSTVGFQVADKNWLNDKKMTMLGRFALQKILYDMVKAGCKYAVVETSSEGIKQARHKGINYDWLVFTNLTPEHIESHGNFEKYKKAKLELFKNLMKKKHKRLEIENPFIKKGKIPKMTIINGDDKYALEFLNCGADKKILFGIDAEEKENFSFGGKNELQYAFRAKNVRVDGTGTYFSLDGMEFRLSLLGKFNAYNAIPAIILGKIMGLNHTQIKKALEKVKGVPGRMEFIEEGQNFSILVDYAHEPSSMAEVFKTLKILKEDKKIKRIIHVLGSCGGGRDRARRIILGGISGENADISIVTNEDPYDDDPMEIIDEVAGGVFKSKKSKACPETERNKNQKFIPVNTPLFDREDKNKDNLALFKILDRREAIKKALELAEKDDLILITGKGAEQAICVANGKKLAWDDREVAREEIRRFLSA